jgi:hypothetical protein
MSAAVVPSLSVILPAYNEEPNIATAIVRVFNVLSTLAHDYEVIIVDDGSTDGTGDEVRRLMAGDGHLRLIRHETNRGYGAAIRNGFRAARGSLVFYTDADNQFDVGELRYFLPLVDHSDVMVGFRVYRDDTVVRSILSWLYNRLVRVLFRVRIRDVDCAFKLLRHEALDKIELESTDFFVDTEILAKARKWNFRIVEKGARHYPRVAGETTVRASDIRARFAKSRGCGDASTTRHVGCATTRPSSTAPWTMSPMRWRRRADGSGLLPLLQRGRRSALVVRRSPEDHRADAPARTRSAAQRDPAPRRRERHRNDGGPSEAIRCGRGSRCRA